MRELRLNYSQIGLDDKRVREKEIDRKKGKKERERIGEIWKYTYKREKREREKKVQRTRKGKNSDR